MPIFVGVFLRSLAALASGWVASDIYNESKKAEQNTGSAVNGVFSALLTTKNLLIFGAIAAVLYYLKLKNK